MARSITADVGKAISRNLVNDVKIVQEMLNAVPRSKGGPETKLLVDGMVGPKLVAAIRQFQAMLGGAPNVDGKVTPDGKIMAALNKYDSFPALTTASQLRCAHGGMVTVTPAPKFGRWAGIDGTPLFTSDPVVVSGCPMDSPCRQVKWISSPSNTLDARSVGLSLTRSNHPQGEVQIVSV